MYAGTNAFAHGLKLSSFGRKTFTTSTNFAETLTVCIKNDRCFSIVFMWLQAAQIYPLNIISLSPIAGKTFVAKLEYIFQLHSISDTLFFCSLFFSTSLC